MKKLLLALMLFAAISINGGAAASNPEYSVTVKNGSVDFPDVKPISIENVTYIPLRAIFEKLGCEVTWDPDTRTSSVKRDKTLLLYPVQSNKFFVNGEEKIFESEGLLLNDRIMVPMSFFTTLGMEVNQDGYSISLICKSCSK